MRKRRLIRKPFKGWAFYEWQVGPLVFQVRRRAVDPRDWPLFHVWRDRYWR